LHEKAAMSTESSRNIVIVAYKPKPGKEAELLQLTREHVPLLRAEGLATDRPVTACQAKDGTIVEVFEWVAGGTERAHSNPAVMQLWNRYSAACEYVPLVSLAETSNLFASFTPLEL
jgi:hypothetical protein